MPVSGVKKRWALKNRTKKQISRMMEKYTGKKNTRKEDK